MAGVGGAMMNLRVTGRWETRGRFDLFEGAEPIHVCGAHNIIIISRPDPASSPFAPLPLSSSSVFLPRSSRVGGDPTGAGMGGGGAAVARRGGEVPRARGRRPQPI